MISSLFTSTTQIKSSHFARYCSKLSSNPHQTNPTYGVYDHLLRVFLQQCGRLNARQMFDELPQRVSQVSHAGKVIHAQSLRRLGLNGQLGNAVLDLYAKCGNDGYAKRVFDGLEDRDVEAWNSVMSLRLRTGLFDDVAGVFGLMRDSGVVPNQFSYAVVLSACARMMAVGFGKQVHCDVVKTGYLCSSFCEGSLIDMYVKCNALVDARKLFEQAEYPSLVSWTAMIVAYVQSGLPGEALKLFECMQQLGCVADRVAFVTLISALVNDGKLVEARNLFTQMPLPNAIAWNLMISGHTRGGYYAEAINFFLNMRKSGVSSTRSTLASVLSAVASVKDLDVGLSVHGDAIKQGLDGNVYVGSSLINMYAKCQKPESARRVFDSLHERNIILWNAMLGCYAQNDCAEDVVELFVHMMDSGFQADAFTYTSILSGCGYLERPDLGEQLHSVIVKSNFESNLFVANALVDMYAKSRALVEARHIFESIQDKDNVSWNALIVGFVQVEEEDKAFVMFQRMMSDGTAPDEVAFSSILSSCANLKDLSRGRQIHCVTVKHGLDTSLYVGSSLIDMYVKGGATATACEVFCCMPNWSVVSMNTLIAGHAHDNLAESVALYNLMQAEGLCPSEITYANLLDACHGPSKCAVGRQIHSIVLKKGFLYDDGFLGVSLLGMYMGSQRKKDAVKLFFEFPDRKTVILWTCMISGLNQNECHEEALQLYREMRTYDVKPDQATFASVLKSCSTLTSLRYGAALHSLIFHMGFNSDLLVCSALIDMYAKGGDVKSSVQVFKEIGSKWDVIPWNSVIVGLAKNGYVEDALQIFDEMMLSHVDPDDVTFLGVLSACTHAGKISEGRRVYDIMVNKCGIQPRNDHCACMIDLFGRWGLLEEAEGFIENLNFEPDAMIWASFLGACKLHGDDTRGKKAAEKLIRLDPLNSSAYVLLSSIHASAGNWDEVDSLRRQMSEKGVTKFPGSSWVNRLEDNLVQCLQ